MDLSITICTYNRVKYLKKCLESILLQTKGKKYIEINVIDNNSNDNTRDYIYQLQKKFPEVNYYVQKKQGISYSRNFAFKVCKGFFLAFVDDDATINKNWLCALLNELKNKNENIIYGGPIYPKFESEPNKWIDKHYFIRKFKKKDGYLGKIKSKEGFSGGNMCLSKNLFLKSEQFNTKIGMKGGNLGLGEEPDFYYKLVMSNKNVKLYNISKMSITHFEANYKLKKEYIKERIILNAKQFSQRTMYHESIFASIIILSIKIVYQFIKLIYSFFTQLVIDKHKFKYLKSYWTIIGIITVTFQRRIEE